MSLGHRVYRILLRLLPGDFRGDFGGAMLSDLTRAQLDGVSWRREIGGLVAAIVREHADALRQDVKYAWRMMRRTPGFTLMAIVMLALGTGVNVAMFSVIDAVMLRSPFVAPDELARAYEAGENGAVKPIRVDELPKLATAPPIAGVGIVGAGNHVLTTAGEPKSLDSLSCVSASMFDVLKTPPLIGRVFGPEEDRSGAAPTVVLAYTFWQTLGGSESILGTALSINHTPVTVIGVMPRGYYGALARPNTPGWVPYHSSIADADNAGCRRRETETTVVRLRPGVSRDAAAAMMPGYGFTVLESVWMDSVRKPLKILAAAVMCVLLIACLNVGGLQMERTLARRRELSLRLALGAGRARLARQILTENLLFAIIGAAAGLGATALSIGGLISLMPPNVPYMDEIAVNGRALIWVIAVAAVSGLVSGVFPLLETRRFAAGEGVASTRSTENRASWTRRGLVVSQIALSLVVLIGAGLMIQTFRTLTPAAPGFDPDHKLWQPARLRGASPEANAAFYRELFDKLRGAPAIVDVAGTTYVPMINISDLSTIEINGKPLRPFTNSVTPNYFALMKIPIVAGRGFTGTDAIGAAPVVIVNRALAERIDPSGDVVGRRLKMDLTLAGLPGPARERAIVGVIANTRSNGGDLRPRPEAYVPYTQNPAAGLTLIVEHRPGAAAEAAAEVRTTLLSIRPNFVVTPPTDLRSMIEQPVATSKFGAWVLGMFAGLAVLLAGVGLTTTIGWWVAQRTRELGVRIALGATRSQIVGLVARQGLALAALGVAAGCGIAALVTQYMTSWIYGVTPIDRATFAVCGGLMLAVAAAALLVPTRRASRVDPVLALRAE
jgi:putative ABC transport system permease protein